CYLCFHNPFSFKKFTLPSRILHQQFTPVQFILSNRKPIVRWPENPFNGYNPFVKLIAVSINVHAVQIAGGVLFRDFPPSDVKPTVILKCQFNSSLSAYGIAHGGLISRRRNTFAVDW